MKGSREPSNRAFGQDYPEWARFFALNRTGPCKESFTMARIISHRYFILQGIVLGLAMLLHAPSSAQGTSVSERAKLADQMKADLQNLDACEKHQSQLKTIRDDLGKSYQDYLQGLEAQRKAKAAVDKAESEFSAASLALEEAKKIYRAKDEKCERLMRLNPQADRTKMQDCVDAAYFLRDVVGARKKTCEDRQRALNEKEAHYREKIAAADKAADEYMGKIKKSLNIADSKYVRLKPPDEFRNELDDYCRRLHSYAKKDLERAAQITFLLVKDCRFDEADRFVNSLPEFGARGFDGTIKGKSELARPISEAREREEAARKKYVESNSLYRQAQAEERAGNASQAGKLYRDATRLLQEGRAMTKCDSKVSLFDKAIKEVDARLARPAGAASAAGKPVKPEWLSDDEAKAFIRELDVEYLQKWLRKWCPTSLPNCAIVPTSVWGGLHNRAWWARTREKQGIVRKLADCIHPCVMDVGMHAGERDARLKNCYADNPFPP